MERQTEKKTLHAHNENLLVQRTLSREREKEQRPDGMEKNHK